MNLASGALMTVLRTLREGGVKPEEARRIIIDHYRPLIRIVEHIVWKVEHGLMHSKETYEECKRALYYCDVETGERLITIKRHEEGEEGLES